MISTSFLQSPNGFGVNEMTIKATIVSCEQYIRIRTIENFRKMMTFVFHKLPNRGYHPIQLCGQKCLIWSQSKVQENCLYQLMKQYIVIPMCRLRK